MKSPISILVLLLVLIGASACKDEPVTPTPPSGGGGGTDGESVNWDWYTIDTIGAGMYALRESRSSQGNTSYLLVGDDQALMYDSGTGENIGQDGIKIKDIIEAHTSLPITLLLSHFHFDHNQNVGEFDKIGMPDLPSLRSRVGTDSIFTFTNDELFEGTQPREIKVSEWLPVDSVIDVGNRSIELISIPGHTDESVAVVDRTEKIALLGDFLYNGQLYVFDENDLPAYLNSTDHLISELDSDYRIFGAHGQPEVDHAKLQTLRNFIVCIQNGACQGSSGSVFGYPVLNYSYQGMSMLIFQ